MNYPAINQNTTMSSTQLAELLNKPKKEVNRQIKAMFADKIVGGIITPTFRNNGQVEDYHLPELESNMYTAKYDTYQLEKICQYWIDRKKSQSPVAELTYEETMHRALTMADKKVKALESKVETLEPKAEALDRIATADGSLCISDAAKALQVQPKKVLFPFLQFNRWIYKRAGGKSWLGYQDKVQQGLLEHKITTQLLPDGSERIREQVLITSKGLAKLSSVNMEVAA